MRYCDYLFYKEEYSGKMSLTTFKKMSLEASMYIKRNISSKFDENNIPDELKYCMCVIADKLIEINKRKGKTSESVGTWSVNYQENSNNEKELYDTLVNYLLDVKTKDGNSILYRGC